MRIDEEKSFNQTPLNNCLLYNNLTRKSRGDIMLIEISPSKKSKSKT